MPSNNVLLGLVRLFAANLHKCHSWSHLQPNPFHKSLVINDCYGVAGVRGFCPAHANVTARNGYVTGRKTPFLIGSVRQETPDFFPGWRLMNSGLDAFVPATIQNSS
jgi:hypothetical protein